VFARLTERVLFFMLGFVTAAFVLTHCATSAKGDLVVRGEILDRAEGSGVSVEGERVRKFYFKVGYRNLQGAYEVRPFLLTQAEVMRARIEGGTSEVCVDLSAWPALVACP
jgi:hypothetical protein